MTRVCKSSIAYVWVDTGSMDAQMLKENRTISQMMIGRLLDKRSAISETHDNGNSQRADTPSINDQ